MSDVTTTDEAATEAVEAASETGEYVAQKKHSLALRWMHWVNFPVMMVMMYSGMRIYWADRADPYAIGIGGWQLFRFWPNGVNSALQLERKLAQGLAFHLNFGWFFVLNGALYMLFLSRRGEWRHIVPDVQGIRDSRKSVAHDLKMSSTKPVQGKYNPAQQVVYSLVIVIAFLLVASGFAIYKPGQLSWLEAAFGGYDYARLVHFTSTIVLFGFFFMHIIQVMRAGWSNFASMITGYRLGRREDPEVAPPWWFGPDGIEGTDDDLPRPDDWEDRIRAGTAQQGEPS